MNILFKKVFFFIFFFSFFLQIYQIALSEKNIFVVLKVDDKIITNVDIQNELNYLIALNNDLKDIDRNSVIKIAKDSLVREAIKIKELTNYFDLSEISEISNDVIKDFYIKLNLNDEEEFINYLKLYKLSLTEIKTKIGIEILWNNFIAKRYQNQVNVDVVKIKEKIKNEKISSVNEVEYNLSEIIFRSKTNQKIDALAIEIQESIKTEGFNNSANKYSLADSSKFGGRIGWIKKTQLSKDLIEKLKNLKVNEISDVIKITNGFMILKINDMRTIKKKLDNKKILEEMVNFEQQKQYNQYSIIHYNKLKNNTLISE